MLEVPFRIPLIYSVKAVPLNARAGL